MNGDKAEPRNIANNKLLIKALTADLERMVNTKLDGFKQEIQQMKKRGFTRTGVGTNSYTRLRYLREEKTSYYKGSMSVVTPRECDKIVIPTQHPKEYEGMKSYAPKRTTDRNQEKTDQKRADHVRLKRNSDQNKKISDQSSKQQTKQFQTQIRKQKLDDDLKKCKQEMLEILETFQKKKRDTHQSVDTKTDKEGSQRLEILKPEQDQPSHKEIMVHTENIEAKSISQPSLESSCEQKQCKSSNLSKYKGATCYTCRKKGHIAATCPGKMDLNFILVESKQSSSNSSSEKGLEQSDSCVMHLFLSRDVDSGNTLELENGTSQESTNGENQISITTTSPTSLKLVENKPWDRVSLSDGTKMELGLYTLNQGYKFEHSSFQGAERFSNPLRGGTQESLAYESVQFLNNLIFTRSFKQSVLNIETSTTRSLTMNQTEQSTHFVREPILLPNLCDYTRMHCKEVDLFVIVSAEDEKRFGLEKVKEFRVQNAVFDKMISSFEAFTPERFSKQMGFQFNNSHEFSSSQRVSWCSDVFDLFRTKTEGALFRTWPELICLFKHMFGTLERLFFYSYHTFDVFSLVFVKEKERQDKSSKAENDQVWSNQVDYEPSQHMIFLMGFWSWKYLRKTTSNAQGGLELSRFQSTNQEHGKVVRTYSIFQDKPPDILLVLRSDYNFQQGKIHKGLRIILRRTRSVQMWEEDQRFKPPDLDQHEDNKSSLFCLIKEEPPDAKCNSKLRLCKSWGKLSIRFKFIHTNLLYFHEDNSDLRSNPFQVGGDDVIMTSSRHNIENTDQTRVSNSVDLSSRDVFDLKGESNDMIIRSQNQTRPCDSNNKASSYNSYVDMGNQDPTRPKDSINIGSRYTFEGSQDRTRFSDSINLSPSYVSNKEGDLIDDVMKVPAGPMTRSRAKLYSKVIGGLLVQIQTQEEPQDQSAMMFSISIQEG